MLATLPIREHIKHFLDNRKGAKGIRGKKSSEDGRKGRIAAKLSTPVHLKGSGKIPIFKKLRFGR